MIRIQFNLPAGCFGMASLYSIIDTSVITSSLSSNVSPSLSCTCYRSSSLHPTHTCQKRSHLAAKQKHSGCIHQTSTQISPRAPSLKPGFTGVTAQWIQLPVVWFRKRGLWRWTPHLQYEKQTKRSACFCKAVSEEICKFLGLNLTCRNSEHDAMQIKQRIKSADCESERNSQWNK